MHLNIYAHTDPGRARANNEDSVAFDEGLRLCVLADGMGGYNAGEVASGMTTDGLLRELSRWLRSLDGTATPRDARRAIELCVDGINRAVFEAANGNGHYSGMGTTLVLGLFFDHTLLLGHIGDSRCYRLRGAEFSQLTKDHSLLQEQLDAGLITLDQAATSPDRNLVTRALGVEDTVQLELHEHRCEVEDIYLMCSDGLFDMVANEDMAQLLRAKGPIADKAKSLVDLANENGGRDNITVLLARVQSLPPSRGLVSRWLGR